MLCADPAGHPETDLPALRLLIVSGEACPADLVTRWHSPERRMLNAYGPTETTVTATLAHLQPGQAMSIGKPLPGYTAVILEPGTQQVLPPGTAGEIVIGGVGVAAGYLNRPEQTRQAFIPDFLQLANNPSGLLYRTGDLGLINAAGEIEYAGRIDLQVKIRGYRIELTEIESVLLACPGIAQAVVDVYQPLPEVRELVAYYTLSDRGPAVTVEALIRQLRAQLPSYMLPTRFERLERIPMLASDKADRKALPAPSGRRFGCGQQGRHRKPPPSSNWPTCLASCWVWRNCRRRHTF
ncbi:MAG: AMP-binding protein [Thiolinea sp.]